MRRFVVVILLAIFVAPIGSSAQNFIGKSYTAVKKKLKKYNRENDSVTVKISDSSGFLHLSYRGRGTQPADFIYGFDEKRKCRSEKVIAYCDSCYKKYLDAVLNDKKYNWQKINMNQYVSSFEHKMMIELPVPEEDSLFYLILRTNWVKETYQMLKPSK